ncbi:MAG: hypothetical protein WDW38_006414 [Sanguina aurantia]
MDEIVDAMYNTSFLIRLPVTSPQSSDDQATPKSVRNTPDPDRATTIKVAVQPVTMKRRRRHFDFLELMLADHAARVASVAAAGLATHGWRKACRAEQCPARQRVASWFLHGRGVFVCISPWNFPLAIFLGQVGAALAAGNAVLAKPAEQTSLIGHLAVQLLHAAGVPADVLQYLPGDGATVGAALTKDPRIAGVAFTGSTDTAWAINRSLAARNAAIATLIAAETGGQNAMIADSSALPEQIVKDVIASAFQSAGQRCSAARILFVQEDIADKVIDMLAGAMAELTVGDPGQLSTDVGPVIDEDARKLLAAIVVNQINATGYGLTLGIHSRIDDTIVFRATAAPAHAPPARKIPCRPARRRPAVRRRRSSATPPSASAAARALLFGEIASHMASCAMTNHSAEGALGTAGHRRCPTRSAHADGQYSAERAGASGGAGETSGACLRWVVDAAVEHAAQPVHGGIRIGRAHRLVQRRDLVVAALELFTLSASAKRQAASACSGWR